MEHGTTDDRGLDRPVARSVTGHRSACEVQLLLRGELASHEDVIDEAAVKSARG